MPKSLDHDERIRRARTSIVEARRELGALPESGRARTYIIARARKHLRAATIALRPLLARNHPTRQPDAQALVLEREIDALWPTASSK